MMIALTSAQRAEFKAYLQQNEGVLETIAALKNGLDVLVLELEKDEYSCYDAQGIEGVKKDSEDIEAFMNAVFMEDANGPQDGEKVRVLYSVFRAVQPQKVVRDSLPFLQAVVRAANYESPYFAQKHFTPAFDEALRLIGWPEDVPFLSSVQEFSEQDVDALENDVESLFSQIQSALSGKMEFPSPVLN